MGFFSWNCKRCGHPMLCLGATNERNEWMNNVVVIESDGSILKGSYDGYGRVNEREINDDAPECYHRKCWEASGMPVEYTEGSDDSRDQGWFFNDKDHVIDPPEGCGLSENMEARERKGKYHAKERKMD